MYEVNIDPKVQFVVRGNDAATFEGAFDLDRLRALCEEATDLRNAIGAVEVQYLYSDVGWQFNYLITSSGTVIGTRAAIEETDRRMALLIDQSGRRSGRKEEAPSDFDVIDTSTNKGK